MHLFDKMGDTDRCLSRQLCRGDEIGVVPVNARGFDTGWLQLAFIFGFLGVAQFCALMR